MICHGFADFEVPQPVLDCDADLEELHPALQGVTFEAVPWIKDVLRDARLSTRYRAEDAYAFRHPIHLGCHPLACRSFASFPPVQILRLSSTKGIKLGSSVVENRFGVTVYDILQALHVSLDILVDPKELREYMWDFPPGIHKDSEDLSWPIVNYSDEGDRCGETARRSNPALRAS
ncbi:hypothetical protein OH76DRAFT_1064439 [Lentinus brumalis]|uniref:Uncharacterized protein n=1 Tax=Lentinus brumalis TaxID=2498619 RepID=A0A371DNI8_9APHY|nr:hypothetical protein OH76DRAFT_1064439 [Polyporus brumalis]